VNVLPGWRLRDLDADLEGPRKGNNSEKKGMNLMPGWNSMTASEWWSNFYFWVYVASLAVLIVSGIMSLRYTQRKDALVDEQSLSAQLSRHYEIAAVQPGVQKTNRGTASLQHQIEQERQMSTASLLSNEQKRILVTELRGKILKMNLVVQKNWEANPFEAQVATTLVDTGIELSMFEAPAGEKLPVSIGVGMYSPVARDGKLDGDPVYEALKKTQLFSGTVAISPMSTAVGHIRPSYTLLPTNEYALFIGQAPPS